MGLYKWETLGIPSRISAIEPPSNEDVIKAKGILLDFGLTL